MIRRHIGIYGVHEESLRLTRLLAGNPDVEVTHFFDTDREAAVARAAKLGPDLGSLVAERLCDDLGAFLGNGDLQAVVDDGQLEDFGAVCPSAMGRDIQIVSPLTARLLWGYGVAPRDRKAELLQALNEVVESVELTIDSDELFTRMLEIAVSVTGAEGGSLMLLDPQSRDLRIQVAIGVEPELWPKIRVALGEGIAGQAAATARPIRLRGKADRRNFNIVRERLDVEAALCVPLVHEGNVLGVLNLHHATRADTFSDEDLRFMEQLATLDARIIERAGEHKALRNQAARYEAVREIHDLLAGSAPLSDRLRQLCKCVAGRMGNGIANLYLHDREQNEDELRLSATSLEGGGFGGEYRIVKGQGVDGRAALSRRPIFLRGEQGELAYAALPLLAGERLLGVLAAQAGAHPPRGRSVEEGLLEIAAAVADGVARSDRERRIRTRATQLNAINETGIRMLSASEVSEVARLATSSLAMILDADHAIVRLQDPDTRRYCIASYFGSADECSQDHLFRLDKRTCVEAIKRRTALLVRDIEADPHFGEFAQDFRSLVSAPLKDDGQVIGTLSIYDKVALDRFFPGRFNDDDLQVFAKFVSYVERALANARVHAALGQRANFDSASGLPTSSYLATRVQEEITRAGEREGALALAVCLIENWREIEETAGLAMSQRVMLATAGALRAELRSFDVLARVADDRFCALLPEPRSDVREHVFQLARAVADHVAQDEALNTPTRVSLAFGYAIHPTDGASRDALLARAAEPRIRMA